MSIPRKWFGIFIGAFAVIVMLWVGFAFWRRAIAREFWSSQSPGGRFKIIAYRMPMFSATPGQSGDAPGYVRLIDTKAGRTLQQKNVEMLSSISVSEIEWSATNVCIRLFADWRLPE